MKKVLHEISFKKGDAAAIIVLLLISAIWFCLSFGGGDRLVACVYSGGEEVLSVDLSALEKPERRIVSGCEILFEREGASFADADCPNRLCVKAGRLSRPGDTAACVPNGVVIVLEGGKQNADVVSY